jgi:hypothetical protein
MCTEIYRTVYIQKIIFSRFEGTRRSPVKSQSIRFVQ